MKTRLTALLALTAVVALPALASAEPLIYPDIPAKMTMDDHLAVMVPLASTATKTTAAHNKTAVIVPKNGDASEALAGAETTYLTSECPAALSRPADHSAMLDRFCQDGHA